MLSDFLKPFKTLYMRNPKLAHILFVHSPIKVPIVLEYMPLLGACSVDVQACLQEDSESEKMTEPSSDDGNNTNTT